MLHFNGKEFVRTNVFITKNGLRRPFEEGCLDSTVPADHEEKAVLKNEPIDSHG